MFLYSKVLFKQNKLISRCECKIYENKRRMRCPKDILQKLKQNILMKITNQRGSKLFSE